jgi:hypothetical protein
MHIDKLYSAAQRMKHGGHINEGTFRNYYMPNNPGTDGQDAYLGGKLRTIVTDLFRGMTLSRNPDLFQSLPAEKEYELEASAEFAALNGELEELKGQPSSEERELRRRSLYAQRRKLRKAALRQCREGQPCKNPSTVKKETDCVGGHRTLFARISCLMPERRRLASSMFLVGSLRGPEGRCVLQDMIALCRQETDVVFRPGLEPEKCHCPATRYDGKPDKYAAASISSRPT